MKGLSPLPLLRHVKWWAVDLNFTISLSDLINIWTHSASLKTGNQFERQDKYYLLPSHLL